MTDKKSVKIGKNKKRTSGIFKKTAASLSEIGATNSH
jgi:hypothetical protein